MNCIIKSFLEFASKRIIIYNSYGVFLPVKCAMGKGREADVFELLQPVNGFEQRKGDGYMLTKEQEIFDLVDEHDNVIGSADRDEFHGNPGMIHRVVHILVFDSSGELYLQKRSITKDVQPGKWDTSVGGHVNTGESYEEAAYREMHEELGIQGAVLEFLYRYLHTNDYESEFVSTYRCVWNGAIEFNRDEIEAGRFWSMEQIREAVPGKFTPNFLDELERFRKLQQM
ncbi:MAG: NUDIX domain-containing protein [Spirochaetales bacterium]|nr:NUDIX domain-containing protein [Spirochaetales bacterium]